MTRGRPPILTIVDKALITEFYSDPDNWDEQKTKEFYNKYFSHLKTWSPIQRYRRRHLSVIKICKTCEKKFETSTIWIFCSLECRNNYVRKKCKNCDAPIRTKNKFFCCSECHHEYTKNNPRPKTPPKPKPKKKRICKECEKEYVYPDSGGYKFCTIVCRKKWYAKHKYYRTATCKECGKKIRTTSYHATYCLECNKKRTILLQLDGGPTREFAKFILILREVEKDIYLRTRKIYNQGAPLGANENFLFDKYLAMLKSRIEKAETLKY